MIAVPENLETMKLPDPSLLSYYKDIENRVLSIECEIGQELLEFSRMIIKWNEEDKDIPVEERKPIKIRIFSYGGELDACFSFISIMTLSKTPIWTYNMGVSMSAALLILLAGSRRFCLPMSTALIHSGSSGISGTAEQVIEASKNYKMRLNIMKDFILDKTQITPRLYTKNQKIDWYIPDTEQVSLGIVHEIVSDIESLF